MYTRPGTGAGFNDGSSYASSSHYSGLPPGHGGLPHGLPVTLSAHSSISGANRVVDALASGTVKEQRLKSARGQDIAIFVEMDDGGGDVFLSGRVSPRLPASGARVTFRLSLTEEHRWVAKNGEWLYESMAWPEPADPRLAPPRRRPGKRVDGVVSTRKPSSACCWITTGDLNGGVYCLSKWCPGGQSPPLGAIVTFELKQGKKLQPVPHHASTRNFNSHRGASNSPDSTQVAHPPGLAVVGHESILLERTLLDRGTPEMISGPQRPEPFSPPPLMTPSMASRSVASRDSRRSQHSSRSVRSSPAPAVSLSSRSLQQPPPPVPNTWTPPPPQKTTGYLNNIQANLAQLMGRVRVNDAPPPAPAPLMAPRGPALIDDAPPQPRGRLGSIAAPPGPGWLDAPRPPSPAPAPGYDNTWTPSAYASEWQPGEPPRRAS